MKDSLSQAALFFRSRLSTWLPVVVAAVLAFLLRRAETLLSYRVLLALLPYSVFDHKPDFRALPHVATKAILYTMPLNLLVVFLIVLAYAIALLVVSSIVRRQPETPRPGAFAIVSAQSTRLLNFCLKSTAAFFLPGLFVTLLLVSTKPFPNSVGLANDFLLLLHLGVAFLVARWSLPLLRSPNSRAVPAATLTQAGLMAILAVILSTLLDALLLGMEKPWMAAPGRAGLAVFGAALGNTLLESLPTVFLFIILSVLAAQDDYLA